MFKLTSQQPKILGLPKVHQQLMLSKASNKVIAIYVLKSISDILDVYLYV